MVGNSAAAIHCRGTFEIVGETTEVLNRKQYFSYASVE